MEPQAFKLLRRKLEHEVLGKTPDIAPDGLIERLCFNAIELGEVRVQHHLLPANQEDGPLDALRRDGEI